MTTQAERIARLRVALAAAEAEIDAAYWRFTRMARAKPPCLVVPDAYARRTKLKAALRAALAEEEVMP